MKDASITRASTYLLQSLVVLIGIGVLVFLLWEPHVEGVNANATTLFEIYFDDPFLAYAYIGSIPFFVGLYQAHLWLGNRSVAAVRNIKRCALIFITFVLGAEAYIVITMYGKDDIAGGVAMGLFAIVLSAIVAGVAAVMERSYKAS